MAQPSRQFTQTEQPGRQKQAMSESRAVMLPRRRITKGEKILWTSTLIVIFVVAIIIISRQAQIYSVSISATHAQSAVNTIQQSNGELNEQIQKLQQPGRIMKIAKEHGLSLNINNVKLVDK